MLKQFDKKTIAKFAAMFDVSKEESLSILAAVNMFLFKEVLYKKKFVIPSLGEFKFSGVKGKRFGEQTFQHAYSAGTLSAFLKEKDELPEELFSEEDDKQFLELKEV